MATVVTSCANCGCVTSECVCVENIDTDGDATVVLSGFTGALASWNGSYTVPSVGGAVWNLIDDIEVEVAVGGCDGSPCGDGESWIIVSAGAFGCFSGMLGCSNGCTGSVSCSYYSGGGGCTPGEYESGTASVTFTAA
jgi:hypothetical protein